MISLSFGREPGSSALDETVSENDTFTNAADQTGQDNDDTVPSLRPRALIRKRAPKNNIPPFTVISAPHAGRD